MPSRHISPQSFDSILSELGDDPAIPDPHGIRKRAPTNPPPFTHPSAPKASGNVDAIANQNPLTHLKKLGPLLAIVGTCAALSIAFLMAYSSIQAGNQTALDDSQKQISELKKEFAILRNEITEIEDSVYASIDEIEVSIHSFNQIKPNIKTINKPKSTPHETELRNWRYLGLSQAKGSHQAFFHNGKTNVMVESGGVVLGDWVLQYFSRESATLTHTQGKSITLKPSKSE